MFNLNQRKKEYNNEPGINYFKKQIAKTEHTYRQAQVTKINRHLQREHSVLNRMADKFTFKNKEFVPAAIILQGIKTVVNFHTAYLVGNPVTITGSPDAVEFINKVYRKGIYAKTDWKILNELMTYGNAFEYVYIDEDNHIKSKVFRNKDSYPIYDENMNYTHFVEYWKSEGENVEHFNIYYPNHVDSYRNGRLISSKVNLTGLPIHYSCMERAKFDQFGDSLILDLMPIQDKIEVLLSKLDDAITTLSLNPLGILTGNRITETDMINTNISGAVLNLDVDADFKYANAEMDYNNIKFELNQLYQQFNIVAATPSSILGQNNITNVSENSMSMVYQLTENRGKQNMYSLLEGFKTRWEYMRKLNSIFGKTISDNDFDSLNVSFNINKPIDTQQHMENMKIQYEMGALSKRTVMEQSPYTTDSAQELQRLEDEGKSIYSSPIKKTKEENSTV